jgi:hypothetical protein
MKSSNDRLHFHKVCARCFPKLPEQHRHNCLDVCNHVLSRYHEEGDLCLLPLIVTGDETLIRHYEPERRPQNVEWKQTMSPVKTKFKSQPVTRKVMPILFWDSQGPVVEKLIWRFWVNTEDNCYWMLRCCMTVPENTSINASAWTYLYKNSCSQQHVLICPGISCIYEDLSKSFWTGLLERELQTVQLSATRCSCIAILWVSLVSFAAITLCLVSQRVFIGISVYFVIDSARKLLDTPSYLPSHCVHDLSIPFTWNWILFLLSNPPSPWLHSPA